MVSSELAILSAFGAVGFNAAQWVPQATYETRSADEVYTPAQREAGDLQLRAGGDDPSGFAEFTQPRCKGKLVLTKPNDDDAVNYLFAKLCTYYGPGWLEALNAIDVQGVRGTHSPIAIIGDANNIVSDPRSVTFTTLHGSGDFWETICAATPRNAAMSWSQQGAIFASTKRPNKAKLFMSWIASDEFKKLQAASGSCTPRTIIYIFKIYQGNTTELPGFAKFIGNQAEANRWKQAFELIIGPAVGPDPMVIYPRTASEIYFQSSV